MKISLMQLTMAYALDDIAGVISTLENSGASVISIDTVGIHFLTPTGQVLTLTKDAIHV
jgi:hypothetical protein